MRFIYIILLVLLVGCQTQFEKNKELLEKDITILELKVRRAKLTNALDYHEDKYLKNE